MGNFSNYWQFGSGKEVLLSPVSAANDTIIVKSKTFQDYRSTLCYSTGDRKISLGRHLGIRLAQQIVDIIESSNTTLVLSTPGA